MENTLIIKEIPLVENGNEEDYMIVGRERERDKEKNYQKMILSFYRLMFFLLKSHCQQLMG